MHKSRQGDCKPVFLKLQIETQTVIIGNYDPSLGQKLINTRYGRLKVDETLLQRFEAITADASSAKQP